MKIKLLFLFLFCSAVVFGQTSKLEQEALVKEYEQSKRQEKIADKMQDWSETMARFGTYPDLPLTPEGDVYYSLQGDFPGVKKAVVFTRTLEWLAIHNELYPSSIYQNPEDGKIIFHYSMPLSNLESLNYTCIITIADSKLLFEVLNISYQQFIPGHYAADKWIYDQTVTKKLNEFYPVTLKEKSDWERTLNIFKLFNDHVTENINSLYDYVSLSSR